MLESEAYCSVFPLSKGIDMLILTAAEARKALPMPEAIETMKNAYASPSGGTAIVPLRIHLPIPDRESLSLFMPAFVDSHEGDALA